MIDTHVHHWDLGKFRHPWLDDAALVLMTESAMLEPNVMDTIERYFDLLQAHVSASEMIEKVLTEDFETGFTDGFHWRGRTVWLSFSTHVQCLPRVTRGSATHGCDPSR